MTDGIEFETGHLDTEVTLPPDTEDPSFPELYVGLEIDLLAPGDGIVTDRHHASADRYEPDDPQNQIGGQISPFTLSGWARYGCERVLLGADTTVYHPGEPNADYMLQDVYERDLDTGYHEKSACVEAGGDDVDCPVYGLFGRFRSQASRPLHRTQRAVAATTGVTRRRDDATSAWVRPPLRTVEPTGIEHRTHH